MHAAPTQRSSIDSTRHNADAECLSTCSERAGVTLPDRSASVRGKATGRQAVYGVQSPNRLGPDCRDPRSVRHFTARFFARGLRAGGRGTFAWWYHREPARSRLVQRVRRPGCHRSVRTAAACGQSRPARGTIAEHASWNGSAQSWRHSWARVRVVAPPGQLSTVPFPCMPSWLVDPPCADLVAVSYSTMWPHRCALVIHVPPAAAPKAVISQGPDTF